MIFWWRRWIEHSRSPRCTSVAVAVAEDLDLDVAGRGRRSARGRRGRRRSRRCGLALRRGHGLVEIAGDVDDAHALAAAAGRGLHEQRVADLAAVGGVLGRRAGWARRPSRRRALAAILSPIDSMTSGGGPTQVRPAASITPGRSRRSRTGSRSPGGRRRRPSARPPRSSHRRRGSPVSSRTASSASRTKGASASASTYTATQRMPIAWALRKIAAGDLAAVGDEQRS